MHEMEEIGGGLYGLRDLISHHYFCRISCTAPTCTARHSHQTICSIEALREEAEANGMFTETPKSTKLKKRAFIIFSFTS